MLRGVKLQPLLLASFLCSALCSACDKKAEPARPNESADAQPELEPKSEPKSPEAETAEASGKEAPSGTVDGTAKKTADDSALTEPPTKAEVRTAATAVLGAKLAKLTPTVRVGSTRFATAFRVVDDPQAAHAATAHLVVLEAADDGTWSAAAHEKLLTVSTPWLEEDEPPAIPVTIKSEDYDDDGNVEILVRVEEQIMCPGAGPNFVTHLSVFNQGEALSPAHQSELHHRNDNGIATKGKAEHVDLNRDGHRDLRITYTTQDEYDGSKKVDVNTWLWDAKTDAFKPEKTAYTASGCDW